MAAVSQLENEYKQHLSASENAMVENMNQHMNNMRTLKQSMNQKLDSQKSDDKMSLIKNGVSDGVSDLFAAKGLLKSAPEAMQAARSVYAKGLSSALGESEVGQSIKGAVSNVKEGVNAGRNIAYKLAKRGSMVKGSTAVPDSGTEFTDMATKGGADPVAVSETNPMYQGTSNDGYSSTAGTKASAPAAPVEETSANPEAAAPGEAVQESAAAEESVGQTAGTALEEGAGKAAASVGGTLDSIKSAVTGTLGETGTKLVGKLAMGVPGALDFGEDLKAGHIVGQSTADKVGNVLTQVGTVLDFVPGLEWLGGLTNAAAAVSSTVGEIKDKATDAANQVTAAQTAAKKLATAATAAANPTYQAAVQAGHVAIASGSANAVNTIAGSGTF